MEKINEKVRAIRQQQGLTQQQLGEALGTTKSNYNRIEKGLVEITPPKLARIAERLGMTPEAVATFRLEPQNASEATELGQLRQRVTDLEAAAHKTNLLLIESKTFFDTFYLTIADSSTTGKDVKDLSLQELNKVWEKRVSYSAADTPEAAAEYAAHRKASPLRAAKQIRIEDAVMMMRTLLAFQLDAQPDVWPKEV